MQRKMKILGVAIILVITLFSLTGCLNRKEIVAEQNNTNTEEKEEENVRYLDFDRTREFEYDTVELSQTVNFKATNYVVDRDFNALFSHEGNAEAFIDGYMQLQDKTDENKLNFLDKNGNIVYTVDKTKYKDIELVEKGCLILTEQTDTYNTSQTVTGVYSLEEEKYVLEPSEEYVSKIRTYGDNMLVINDEDTKFFNLSTKSIVEYPERVSEEFRDGYSVTDDNDNFEVWYLKVFDDKGNVKRIKSVYTQEEIITGNEHENGMSFETNSEVYKDEQTGSDRIRTLCSIYNLETGEAVDLSNEFWSVSNKPHFTKDGYALVVFSNQGGTPYYTVIDKKGNKLFEPNKLNDYNGFGGDNNGEPRKIITEDLGEGNYFIVADEGVTKVIDKDNNEVLTAKENETFEGITNNVVMVHWKESGANERYYYKDMSGNEVKVKLSEEFKEI